MILSIVGLSIVVFSVLFFAGAKCQKREKIEMSKKQLIILAALILTVQITALTLLTTFYSLMVAERCLLVVISPLTAIRCFQIIKGKIAGIRDIIVCSLFAIAIGAWVFYPIPLFLNIAACAIAFQILSVLVLPAYISMAVASTFIIYDVWAVFFCDRMMGLATKAASLPLLLHFPVFSSSEYLMYGLGDIIIPGLVVITASSYARENNKYCIRNAALCGYMIGLVAVFMVRAITDHPQPATLYLCPATIIASCLAASSRGVLWHFLEASALEKTHST